MLTNKRINILCGIIDAIPIHHKDTIVYILDAKRGNDNLRMRYNWIKANMELDDIRFHWLTTKNSFIAGGAVLNWMLQEENNEDTDFFCIDKETSERFDSVIKTYFSFARETHCAKTYMGIEDGVILQTVGTTCSPGSFFGRPEEIIKRFDMDVCKFAVDSDTVYTTPSAIIDLISKSLHYNPDNQIKYITQSSMQRLFKYSRKGFYSSDANIGNVHEI